MILRQAGRSSFCRRSMQYADSMRRVGIGELRSLDAGQAATALSISALDFDFIAYDKRILQAAAQAGLRAPAPA